MRRKQGILITIKILITTNVSERGYLISIKKFIITNEREIF